MNLRFWFGDTIVFQMFNTKEEERPHRSMELIVDGFKYYTDEKFYSYETIIRVDDIPEDGVVFENWRLVESREDMSRR